MGLFFPDDFHPAPGQRLTGFERYREILERDWKVFWLSGFITLVSFLPFAAGMLYAILSSSALVMLAAGVIGGMIAGPFLYGFYDLLYRSLRDAAGNWWENYRRVIQKNWRAALLPGAVLGVFLGCAVFMGMLLLFWSDIFPGWGTLALYLLSLLVSTMLLSVYWPQLVLFEQSTIQRLKNCVLFSARYLWRVLLTAAVQVGYWGLMTLFLPWSGFAMPILGIWFIAYLANFLLYQYLDEAFQIEKEIKLHFPEQIIEQEKETSFHFHF